MIQRDLFVVVADLDAENTIKTLLCHRQEALGVRLEFTPDGDLLRYNGRDSGCFKDAVDLLRTPQRTHRHALLIFDREGCGAENKAREEIEEDIERRLHSSGWEPDRVSVVVIDPELEAWVWARSPNVANVLGWQNDRDALQPFLEAEHLWDAHALKPNDPKEAMRQALRHKNKPLGAPLFSELASRVGIANCHDSAFEKLRERLRRWFGADARL